MPKYTVDKPRYVAGVMRQPSEPFELSEEQAKYENLERAEEATKSEPNSPKSRGGSAKTPKNEADAEGVSE